MIGHIVPNTFYDQFKTQPFCVSDKRVELYGIMQYSGDIALKIHWYENIPYLDQIWFQIVL